MIDISSEYLARGRHGLAEKRVVVSSDERPCVESKKAIKWTNSLGILIFFYQLYTFKSIGCSLKEDFFLFNGDFFFFFTISWPTEVYIKELGAN